MNFALCFFLKYNLFNVKELYFKKEKKYFQVIKRNNQNFGILIYSAISLFTNKRFILDEMFQQNTSKLAIFLECENQCTFFILTFISQKYECPCICRP